MKMIQQFFFSHPEAYKDLIALNKELLNFSRKFYITLSVIIFILIQALFYYTEHFPYNYLNYHWLPFGLIIFFIIALRILLYYYQKIWVIKKLLVALIHLLENDKHK